MWFAYILAANEVAGAPSVDISAIMPAVSNLGALGFAVWYAYYTTTVAIPKLIADHRAERTEMQTRFDGTNARLIEEMKQTREFYASRFPH